jgi:hypothetical protein
LFNSVTVASELDIGNVAEALIYYGRVNLVVNCGALRDLAKKFGPDNLLHIVDMGNLTLTFDRNQYGVVTFSNPLRTHSFTPISLAKMADGRVIRSATDEIEYYFVDEFGASTNTKRIAKKLSDKVRVRNLMTSISGQAFQDSLDQEFLRSAVSAWLGNMVPEYRLPAPLQIETMNTGQGLAFVSNLDFEAINRYYHQRIPVAHSSVSDAYMLSSILGARKEITFSSDDDTELWVGAGEAAMLRTRVNMLVQRAAKSKANIEAFHLIEFEGRTFRGVINSGEKTPADLIDLLEKEEARKFKAWINSQEPSGQLIKEYHRSILEKSGWAERLGVRVGKLFVFAGIGTSLDLALGTMGLATLTTAALGTASSVAFGATDEFVLSRLGKGWKPSQFVEGPAKQFLSGTDKDTT